MIQIDSKKLAKVIEEQFPGSSTIDVALNLGFPKTALDSILSDGQYDDRERFEDFLYQLGCGCGLDEFILSENRTSPPQKSVRKRTSRTTRVTSKTTKMAKAKPKKVTKSRTKTKKGTKDK